MKSAVIIPTYNEKQNITELIEAILKLRKNIQIIIVDDNSPDGTGKVADELSTEHKEVKVIHRKGKLGLGTAYVAGFKYALKNGVDYILEMDADFSHNPKYLSDLLQAIQKYDLVLGSRYLNGVSVVNWEFRRLLLSKLGTLYVKVITGLPVTDATGGFKCFRRKTLESINLEKIRSNGYAFQIEMTYKAYRKGFKIGEVPIVFENRRIGKSKMSKKIILEALLVVWRLQIEYLALKIGSLVRKEVNKLINNQLAKFCIVGTVGFIVNIAIFYITNGLLRLSYNLCAIFSFFMVVTHNFILNKHWTFRDYEKKGILRKYFKYLLTNIGGLSFNLLVLNVLIRFFRILPLFSQIIGVLTGIVINFAGSKMWVFDFNRRQMCSSAPLSNKN